MFLFLQRPEGGSIGFGAIPLAEAVKELGPNPSAEAVAGLVHATLPVGHFQHGMVVQERTEVVHRELAGSRFACFETTLTGEGTVLQQMYLFERRGDFFIFYTPVGNEESEFEAMFKQISLRK